MKPDHFYTRLGVLLYAIAKADGSISKKEMEEIKQLIAERLLHKETRTDAYGSNIAWNTEFAFEIAEESGMNAQKAFKSFIDYAKDKWNQLTDEDIYLCLTLCNKVADAHYHINRQENRMLSTLRSIFNSLEAAQLIY